MSDQVYSICSAHQHPCELCLAAYVVRIETLQAENDVLRGIILRDADIVKQSIAQTDTVIQEIIKKENDNLYGE